ncbi:MAG: DUF1634 domain-containing protein [Anaerolineaceae bacterium]|nr:DUF1634 domain-containing protein [Anaerolineaceae bacterium]
MVNDPVVENKAKGVKTEEQIRFDETLHKLLLIGLYLSVALILFGLGLALFTQQSVSDKVFPLESLISGIVSMNASSFLSLGLLVLIATPIIRVVTSFISFLVEKDWRFAAITLVVLVTVLVSILLGKY